MNKLPKLFLIALCASAASQRPTNAGPLLSKYGVGTVLHPVQEPSASSEAGPAGGADHVYVFAINGLDPLCIGNFNGLCAYMKEHGYANTHFEQLYTGMCIAERVREVRASDPLARIVLIGYSLGCNRVRCLSNRLNEDGTRVDLLVYVGGDFIINSPRSHPKNVAQVLNVRAHGFVLTGWDLLMNGSDLPGATNRKLDTGHLQAPSRRETLSLLMDNLASLSNTPASPNAVLTLQAAEASRLTQTQFENVPPLSDAFMILPDHALFFERYVSPLTVATLTRLGFYRTLN